MPHSRRRRSRSGLKCYKTSRRQRSGYKCSKRVCAQYFKSKSGCKRYRRKSRSGRRSRRRSRSRSRSRSHRRSRSLRGGMLARLSASKSMFHVGEDGQTRRLGAAEKHQVRHLKKHDNAAYQAYLTAKKAAKCGKGRSFSPFGNTCRSLYIDGDFAPSRNAAGNVLPPY